MNNQVEKTPFFSVITPVYNREKCISNAIASIVGQSFIDWEHIIINDGSTDATAAIIDEAANKDHRIKTIHLSPNKGVSAARNAGIRAAKGKYLLFLDSDDEFKDDTFALLHKIIESEKDIDSIIFQGNRITTVPDIRSSKNEPYTVFLRDEIRAVFLAGLLKVRAHEPDHMYRAVLCNKCVKSSIITYNNIFFDVNKKTWEDEEVCIKVIDNCDKIAVVDEALLIERTFDVSDHLSMRYYSDGVKNALSQYKWMVVKFSNEFDFRNDFALDFHFKRIQIWIWRTMSRDENRRALINGVLKDSDFIQLLSIRKPKGIFEKSVRFFAIKKMSSLAYLVYWVQNIINHGETY